MKREYGIDLLRLVSMFMVVLLHVLGHGGFLSQIVTNSVNYNGVWFLEIAAYCAANVFAMITGYLMVQSKFKAERILGIWFQTFFYSFGISLVFFIVAPLTIGKTGLLMSLFPILTNQYWYVTSYFGLFFCIPALNWVISKLTKRQAISTLLLILVVFTVLPMVSGNDLFALSSGYSTLLLIFMFMTGALIKQWDLFSNKKKRIGLVLYLGSVIIVFTKILVIDVLITQRFGAPQRTLTFLSYTSPFIFLSSLGLFLLISSITVKNSIVTKGLKVLSPLAFGVYLFSEHPLIWQTFLAGKFNAFFELSAPLLVLSILGITSLIFFVSLGIEFLRSYLFKLTKVDSFIHWVSSKISTVFCKLLNWAEVRI
jgi:surface polysaccharide O-acyltransferase-like enzyme